MTAAETDGRGLRGKFRELQSECWAVHTEVLIGLVDMVRMAKRSIASEEQI